jgi:alkanesulfonate monooxygenase SsuD/methylene tetrahydromethanopterin reductase-like flavin-dependent oxidoreductase (luciferase family)
VLIGVTLGHESQTVHETVRYAQLAEKRDLDMVGIPDSRFRDTFTSLAAIAVQTDRIRLATQVTNPVTRHPRVLASAAHTLDELAPGRVVVGIGVGASGTALTAQRRASIASLRASLGELTGRDVPEAGAAMRSWTPHVPVLVAAGRGSRSLQAAADLADGAIIHSGASDPEFARTIVAEARSLRSRGPAAGDPFAVWLYSPAFVGDQDEGRAAMSAVVTGLSTSIDLRSSSHGSRTICWRRWRSTRSVTTTPRTRRRPTGAMSG